jgi:pimeloyl-ACP methyl ester carboxylesterase
VSGPERFFETVTGHRLECVWYPPAAETAEKPALVVLHEGLGSVAMWRDFPEKLAAATGRGVLVYSRYGYGQSTRCTTHPVGDHYMHREALEALPELLAARGLERPVLIGHSDGGSIALIHAGGTERPVAGVVTLAAHVFNEDICVAAIEAAREAYTAGPQMHDKLLRYHDDPDGAFWLWNQAWLAPSFRDWNIEAYLPSITCPVLAIQGADDEYGTEAQVDAIANGCGGPVETAILPDCRHSPHRDQPEETLRRIADFVATLA